MTGTDARTGRPLSGRAHLLQSIADILSTPIGTRVMRRDYGSALFELADQPLNPLGKARLFAATADALRRWERRLRLTRLALSADATGAAVLDLEGEDLDAPRPGTLARFTLPLSALSASTRIPA